MRFISMIVAVLLMTGCGQDFSGTYQDERGIQKYSFKNNGKVNISAMGVGKEGNFKREGNSLVIGGGNGGASMTLTIQSDGSLTGLGGMLKLKKIN